MTTGGVFLIWQVIAGIFDADRLAGKEEKIDALWVSPASIEEFRSKAVISNEDALRAEQMTAAGKACYVEGVRLINSSRIWEKGISDEEQKKFVGTYRLIFSPNHPLRRNGAPLPSHWNVCTIDSEGFVVE